MWIINIILWLISHSPILCFSDDNNFATLKCEKIKDKTVHLRMSLLNFMVGDCIVYFITWDIKNKKINIMHVIRLVNVDGMSTAEEKLIEIQNRYKSHISNLEDKDMQIEKEKLCYHIQNEERRIDSSIEKINIYATIILTVVPIVMAIIDIKKIDTLSVSLKVCVFFMLYALLNICAYIFRAIKVQGIKKSKFADLRESEEKGKEVLLQYQYDWQQLRYKADLFVSYVLNLQNWIVLLVILIIYFSIGNSFFSKTYEYELEGTNVNSITTIVVDDIEEPYSFSAIEWRILLLEIEKELYKKIIFIVNDKQDMAFIEELKKYDDVELKIVYDNTLSCGQLKIIREDRK